MNHRNSNIEGKSEIKCIFRYIKVLMALCVIFLLLIPVMLYVNGGAHHAKGSEPKDSPTEVSSIKEGFEIAPFDDTKEGKMAEYGYRLITETYALVGPETKLAITGNRLACASCHLNAGTKPFAAPYIGLSGIFPKYSGRENKIGSLEERINGCFERSMNGKTIDVNSKEMRAIISYIKHISKDVPIGKSIEGQGFVDLVVPDRAADLEKGALVYQNKCQSCHAMDGGGLKGMPGNKEGGYMYPPLWGQDTYNDGAGMARLITAAKFIKGNMPLGVTHDAPLLSDEEAFDVAAFINSHGRPVKAHKEADYPDLTKKPKDCPYPPYVDDIPQKQHKMGPYNFAE